MSNYIVELTPALRNPGTEGSLDTSVLNGKSIQRTAYIEVPNSGNRKIVEVADDTEFDDVMGTILTLPGITIVSA